MTLSPRLRRFTFFAHVTFSVGWLGAVVAYLPLAVTALRAAEAEQVRAAYLGMESIGWFAIVPLSLAALLTGLVQALGTEWGLFRYYWVVAKFVLTVVAVTVLLLHMPTVSRIANGIPVDGGHFGGVHSDVVHAGLGLLVLIATTALSVYKPWGRARST